MGEMIDKYLKPVEENWQPADLLPDPSDPNFFDAVREIRELAEELSYDLLVVLIGDTITEEALPSYESWLLRVKGVDQQRNNGWARWIRAWTAEENRHGDVLNKYLYLCGRVDMREVEVTTQYLLRDGLDVQTGHDPYKNFVYTSFQELATNVSHRRVASQAKRSGNKRLSRLCGVIAADEARHAHAYMDFVKRIFELDPSEIMLAFQDMMKKKIAMPAHLLRQSGMQVGALYQHFSDVAQRIRVYTTQDYVDIVNTLLKNWHIDKVSQLSDGAERARDYLMALPARLQKLSDRVRVPALPYKFKWVHH